VTGIETRHYHKRPVNCFLSMFIILIIPDSAVERGCRVQLLGLNLNPAVALCIHPQPPDLESLFSTPAFFARMMTEGLALTSSVVTPRA